MKVKVQAALIMAALVAPAAATYLMSREAATGVAIVLALQLGLVQAERWVRSSSPPVIRRTWKLPTTGSPAHTAMADQEAAALRETILDMADHAAAHKGEPDCGSPACCGPTVAGFVMRRIVPDPRASLVMLSYTLRLLGDRRRHADMPRVD